MTFRLGLFQAVFSGPPRPAAIKRHELKQRSVSVALLGCFIGHSAGTNRDGPKFSSRGLGTAMGLGGIGTQVSLWDRLVPKRPETLMGGWGPGHRCWLRVHLYSPSIRSKADLKLKVPEKVVMCYFV